MCSTVPFIAEGLSGARCSDCSSTRLPDLAIVIREVPLDRREVETAQDRARRLAQQKELEAPFDEVFDVALLVAPAPPGKLRPGHLHGVPRVLAGVVDIDLAYPATRVRLGLDPHHRDPFPGLNLMKVQPAAA